MDDHDGSFGTADTLIKVKELEEFQREVFPSKSTMSRKDKKLKEHANNYLTYK